MLIDLKQEAVHSLNSSRLLRIAVLIPECFECFYGETNIKLCLKGNTKLLSLYSVANTSKTLKPRSLSKWKVIENTTLVGTKILQQ